MADCAAQSIIAPSRESQGPSSPTRRDVYNPAVLPRSPIVFYKVSILAVCTLAALAIDASTRAADQPHGADAALDPTMGEFDGTLTVNGMAVKAEAKVIAYEDGKYRVVLLSPAGDPKANAPKSTERARKAALSSPAIGRAKSRRIRSSLSPSRAIRPT